MQRIKLAFLQDAVGSQVLGWVNLYVLKFKTEDSHCLYKQADGFQIRVA